MMIETSQSSDRRNDSVHMQCRVKEKANKVCKQCNTAKDL